MTTVHQQKVIDARKQFLEEGVSLSKKISQRDGSSRKSLLDTFRRILGNRKVSGK